METRKLYQTDAYLRAAGATVQAVDGSRVALDATVFYPGGGGQPCDLGVLTGGGRTWTVLKARRSGPVVWHEVEGEPPAVGTAIRGVLDWNRRYALMRTHSALHVLCGVVWRDYGAKVTGGKMKPLQGRMDFEFETLRGELVREIEEKINVEVNASRSVRVSFLPRDARGEHQGDRPHSDSGVQEQGEDQQANPDCRGGLRPQSERRTHGSAFGLWVLLVGKAKR